MVSLIEEDLMLEVKRTEGTGKRVNFKFVRGREQLHLDMLLVLSWNAEKFSLMAHLNWSG